jgi:hypothetical protein
MKFKATVLEHRKFRWAFLALIVSVCGATQSLACSTPVYRYAMYRWFPAPYRVIYMHDSEPGEADLKLHAAIEAYGDYDKKKFANVGLMLTDLRKNPDLKGWPSFIKKAWEEGNDGTLPSYMVLSPLGDVLHLGKLDAAEVKSLIESPARSQIMKYLAEGKTCAYVLLTSSDKKKNAAAEEIVKKAIKAVDSGEIEFYDGELPYWYDEEDDKEKDDGKEEKPKKSKHSIGFVKVERDSQIERWLVRSLLATELDLKEIDEPMVFAVFGRGRAFPPFLGKGITYDNMLDYFSEVTGACSCTVKDQNPGIDLPMLNDWDAVAEAMANRYGSEEGNERSVTDLFPQLVVPGGVVEKSGEEDSDSSGSGEDAGKEPAEGGSAGAESSAAPPE